METDKPRFSPGLVVAIIALVYVCVFGLVMVHGVNMIHEETSVPHQSS